MRCLIACLIVGTSSLLWAQELPEETFIDEWDESSLHYGESLARITYADKYAYLTHEDGDEEPAIRNIPVVSGDYIETKNQSYVEIEFIDGSLMQVADGSLIEFQAINEVYENESLSVIKVHRGGTFLHVTDDWFGAETRIFRLDTQSGSAYVQVPGIYHVNMEGNRMKLMVYRGFAELSGEADSEPVHSGEYATIRNMYRPTRARPFNSFYGDRFERWAYERRPVTDSVSEKYVDARISSYSRDLDEYGEWRYEGDLSTHVWVPYVASDWRPYHRGYWLPSASLLTWVSYDPFGWVTHHYGRWGWSVGLGWYWIPGYYYSPAWVAWTSYNSYVGWCPLGYYNRPYYYRHNRPDVVIVNNHHHRWTYVSSTTIVNRARVYSPRSIAVRGTRRVTTRNIHVTRDDFKDQRRLAQVIREPQLNRERDRTTRPFRSGTLTTGRNVDDSFARIPIRGRNTGTKAEARHLPERPKSNTSRTAGGAPVTREVTGRDGTEPVDRPMREGTRSLTETNRDREPERRNTTDVVREPQKDSTTTPSTPSRSPRSVPNPTDTAKPTRVKPPTPTPERKAPPSRQPSRTKPTPKGRDDNRSLGSAFDSGDRRQDRGEEQRDSRGHFGSESSGPDGTPSSATSRPERAPYRVRDSRSSGSSRSSASQSSQRPTTNRVGPVPSNRSRTHRSSGSSTQRPPSSSSSRSRSYRPPSRSTSKSSATRSSRGGSSSRSSAVPARRSAPKSSGATRRGSSSGSRKKDN